MIQKCFILITASKPCSWSKAFNLRCTIYTVQTKLSIHFSLYLQNTKSLLSIYLHEEDTGMVEREMQKMTIETLISNTAQVTSSNDQDCDDGQWIMFHKDGYDCFLENILVMIKSTRSLAKLFQQCSENIPLYETIIWRFSSDIGTWLLPKPNNRINKTVFFMFYKSWC